MRVIIRTPESEVVSQPEVRSVSLVTELGAMQVFPGHASLHGTILFSPVRIEMMEKEEDFVVQQGFIFIDQAQDQVTILAQRCEKQAEMDFHTAKEYLAVLLKTLDQPELLGKYQLRHLEDEKIATEKRLEVLQKS